MAPVAPWTKTTWPRRTFAVLIDDSHRSPPRCWAPPARRSWPPGWSPANRPRDRQVLGVGAEPLPGEAEDPVADREGRDLTADRLHRARELTALDLRPRSSQPGEEPREERPGPPEPAVGPVHRGRVHLDQHLVVVGRGAG